MRKLGRAERRWILAVVAVATVVGGTALAVVVTASAPPLALPGVSVQSLASQGITLTVPTTQPRVSSTEAKGSVLAQFPGSTIRQVVLVQLSVVNARPSLYELVWAVSVVPAGGIQPPSVGPASAGGAHVTPGSYMTLFFSASTGSFIMGIAGA